MIKRVIKLKEKSYLKNLILIFLTLIFNISAITKLLIDSKNSRWVLIRNSRIVIRLCEGSIKV